MFSSAQVRSSVSKIPYDPLSATRLPISRQTPGGTWVVSWDWAAGQSIESSLDSRVPKELIGHAQTYLLTSQMAQNLRL